MDNDEDAIEDVDLALGMMEYIYLQETSTLELCGLAVNDMLDARKLLPATIWEKSGDSSFHATSIDTWVTNAVPTLTKIIRNYHLDGIDIYYRKFTEGDMQGPDTFASCIGRLISTLKDGGIISFASIAPFDGEKSQNHYMQLWRKYGHLIDYVNFQFYKYDTKSTTVDQFIDYFDLQTILYNGGYILVSLISNDEGGLSVKNGFFAACNKLRSSRKNFMGIFIWCADLSKPKGFLYENQSQALLATPQY
ncbi:hypothetical protein LguiB_000874 [Lonicera macranthoides]